MESLNHTFKELTILRDHYSNAATSKFSIEQSNKYQTLIYAMENEIRNHKVGYSVDEINARLGVMKAKYEKHIHNLNLGVMDRAGMIIALGNIFKF